MSNLMGGPGCTPKELRHMARLKEMTGGRHTTAPTPLMELFGEIAVPLCGKMDNIHLRVWYGLDGWHASWGIWGSVGGQGATPEDAILQAHANFVKMMERNASRKRNRKRSPA